MKKLFILILTFSFYFANAQKGALTVKKYTVGFKIKNANIYVSGVFNGVTADLNFDPSNPVLGSFEGKLDVSSLATGIEMRDKHLKKAEFFDVKNNPFIIIKSVSITKVKENTYSAKCSLTLKGKTKEVVLPFTIVNNGTTYEIKGVLSLKRLDFGIGSPSVIMSNNVEVLLNFTVAQN